MKIINVKTPSKLYLSVARNKALRREEKIARRFTDGNTKHDRERESFT
jgi:hypothetical protein